MPVPKVFWGKLGILQGQPDLAAKGRYTITSTVDRDVVDLFFARVMGDETAVATAENAEQLRALCDELGFGGFDDEIRACLGSDWTCLRGRVDRHDVIIEELQRRVLELERQLLEHRVVERVEAVERGVEEIRRRDAGPPPKAAKRLKSKVSRNESAAEVPALSEEVARLKEAEAKPAKNVPATPTQVTGTEFVYNEERPLDGIIAYLTRKCRGNVHKKGVVNVTSSGCAGNWCKPKNVVDFKSDSYFSSTTAPHSWICYDFKKRRVTPTSYSIRTRINLWPWSWVFEVSNEGETWEVVDCREDDQELNEAGITRNFAVRTPPSGAFRFVRLRLTSPNKWGGDCLSICGLELFGWLSGK